METDEQKMDKAMKLSKQLQHSKCYDAGEWRLRVQFRSYRKEQLTDIEEEVIPDQPAGATAHHSTDYLPLRAEQRKKECLTKN